MRFRKISFLSGLFFVFQSEKVKIRRNRSVQKWSASFCQSFFGMKKKLKNLETVKPLAGLTNNLLAVLFLLLAAVLPTTNLVSQKIVGEEVSIQYESPHPYKGSRIGGE